MANRIADLIIKVGADSYEFQQKVKSVEKRMGDLSKKITSVGRQLSMKLTAPLAALGAVSLSLADTQAKAEAKVQQAIKSTGGAAKLSFDNLKKYASDLQGKTMFGDEEILNNATAQLLTFTNIAGENFKRTQMVALDLSTVLDGDLKSASIQLGKALNDPVKNLSALSRSGIQFSKEQTSTIKTLAETNRLAEAQGVILEELERQYGGQAEAAAKVGLGQLVQLKNSWGDFMEQIGAIMMPVVNKIAGVLSVVVKRLQEMDPAILKTVVVVASLAAAVGPLLLTLGGIVSLLPILKVGFLALTGPIGVLIGLATMLGVAFYNAHSSFKELENIDTKLAVKFVAEGRYDVGDEDVLIGLIDKYKKLLAKNEKSNQDLGIFKNWNADYRGEKKELQGMVALYQAVLLELNKKKNSLIKAKEVEDEIAKILKNGNEPETKESSIINDITNQIDALEGKRLLPETTLQQLAEYNSKIIELRERLAGLNSLTVVKLPEPQVAINTPKLPTTPTDSISPEINTGGIDKLIMKLNNKAVELQGAGENLSGSLMILESDIGVSIRDLATNTAITLSESIGQMAAGDLGFGGLLNNIFMQFANFFQEMGVALITYATTMIAFKKALTQAFANPWVALAVGAAMIVTATVMKSAIEKKAENTAPRLAKGGLAYGETYAVVGDNPNASIDPEVIAPLSKLKQYLTPQSDKNSGGQVEFKIQGDSLVGILNRANYRKNRT